MADGMLCLGRFALEFSLRLITDEVVYNSHVAMLREYFPDPEGIKLADPAPWLTDEHGIFVANPKFFVHDTNSEGYRTPEFDGPDNELGNDFTRSPPVIPGLKRWHITDQSFLGAADFKGNPIIFEEARRQYLGFFGNNLRAVAPRFSVHSYGEFRLFVTCGN